MRIKEFIKRLTYDPKHTKPTDENILHLLLPSIIGILMCMACVAGLTWAWFSSSVSTGTQNIVAANFSIEATVNELEFAADGRYTLEAGNEYRVTLTASGSASQGGYCVIKTASEKQYYTAHISMDASFELTIKPTETETYTFTGVWGTHVEDENNPELENGGMIPSVGNQLQSGNTPSDEGNTPEEGPTSDSGIVIYEVQQGDTLAKIAKEKGTTVDKLATYNNISDPNRLSVGQQLKIPPEDYVIPEKPVTTPPEPNETEKTSSQGTEDSTSPTVSQPDDPLPSEPEQSDNTDISSVDTAPQPPEDTDSQITEGTSETALPPLLEEHPENA